MGSIRTRPATGAGSAGAGLKEAQGIATGAAMPWPEPDAGCSDPRRGFEAGKETVATLHESPRQAARRPGLPSLTTLEVSAILLAYVLHGSMRYPFGYEIVKFPFQASVLH